MRTKLTSVLAVLVGLLASAMVAGPAFASGEQNGYVQICKDAGAAPAVSGEFQFMIGELGVAPDSLSIDTAKPVLVNKQFVQVRVGECTGAIPVTPGPVVVKEINNQTDEVGNSLAPPGVTDDQTPLTVGHWDGDHWKYEFNTDDYAQVSAITTTYPGDPDSAIIKKSVSHGWVLLNVVGGSSADETQVHFANDPQIGYYKICKAQNEAAGLDQEAFSFGVVGAMGYTNTATIGVDGCTDVFTAPAGHIYVKELGDAIFVTDITAVGPIVNGLPTDRLLDSNVEHGTADVQVVAGTESDETVVTYTNDSAQLKVCKVAGDPELVGLPFAFDVNGAALSVTAAPSSDPTLIHCVVAGRYPAGTVMTVTEKPKVGVMLHQDKWGVEIDPWYYEHHNLVLSGNDFTGNIATFTLQRGVTTITFKNNVADPGMLEICKKGGSGQATFTITGPRFAVDHHGTLLIRDVADITTGTDTVKVPVGGCSVLQGPYPYAGVQTITEMGGTPIAATVSDDRLASALAGSAVGAYIGYGTTIVRFTNGMAPDDPPSSSDPPTGSGSTPPASAPAPAATPTAAGTQVGSVVQATAGAQPPKVVARIKVQLGVVKIVKIGSHRYVVLKVTSPKATAKVHLRLISKTGIVLKNADRIVKTNKLVTIKTLPLSKSVAKVRATVVK